jgi:CRISPR-associated protein (TIGR02584 family)
MAEARRRTPVMIGLAGLTPAVVTETLYALAARQRHRVIPREVHLITTHSAYPAVTGALLGPAGALARLREQYRLPHTSLLCTNAHVHVLTDDRGRPLDDIRTAEDSRAAGEQISRLVQDLAADSAIELHCSVAGGRKTMSALLATALQLHGRPGDRLYHVLVNEPFERIQDFYFPPRPPVRYRLDGRPVDSRAARIELAEIPFVRLGAAVQRLGLRGLNLEGLAAEVEAEAQGRLRPETLMIDLSRRCAAIGGRPVGLPPQQLALYAFYAAVRQTCRTRACRTGERCAGCHPTDDEVHEGRHRIHELYQVARPGTPGKLWEILAGSHDSAQALADFRSWLQQTRSRVNRTIRSLLGRGPKGERYLISQMDAGSAQGRRRRGLRLSPEFIVFEGAPGAATRSPKLGASGQPA